MPRTLQSIAASTYRPMRLILVDNHSTDRSHAVCEEFAHEHQDKDFHVVLAEQPDGGAAAARNKGLELCDTPFVYFFDSDDLFDAGFLTAVMPLLKSDMDLLAVPTRVAKNGEAPVTRPFIKTASPVAQVLTGHLSTQAMVFRTDFLRKIGGWNETLPMWNDWELGVRALAAKPRMRWLTDMAFHTVFLHDDSLTGSSFSARVHSMRKAVRAVADETGGTLSKPLRFRMELITGMLLRENDRTEADENKKLTRQWFGGESVLTRFFGFLIRKYVSWGGRGSWRIAYWLCRKDV